MLSVEISLDIDQPLEEVFAYLSNPAHALKWRNTLIDCRPLTSDSLRAGSKFQERVKLLDQFVETTYEVIEYVPASCLTYKSIVGAVSDLVCLHLAPTTGGTHLSMSVKRTLEVLFGLAEPLAARAAQRIIQADLLTLKEQLEQRVDDRRSAGNRHSSRRNRKKKGNSS